MGEKDLIKKIFERLSKVIDPETGVDVVRMRLIEDLCINPNGHVSYKIRPSSELCPLALPLSIEIFNAVKQVEGVKSQELEVVGYAHAEALTELLKELVAEHG
jgi:metal-sulfur cluster biosynthetic enzyme